MKIVFMGTPDFAVPSLEALIENYDVVGIITQPDSRSGRGNKLRPTPVKIVGEKNNIPIYQPEKIKDSEFVEKLKEIDADLFVVTAYGQLLSKEILGMPKYGSINVHGSLLPKYRGAAPVQEAILNGDKTTGITIMQMDEGLDTGDILLKKEIAIEDSDTGGILHDKLMKLGATALIEALELLKKGKLEPEKQDDAKSSYVSLIDKSSGLIDWSKKSEDIINIIRAYNPWPTAFTYLDGKDLFKIYEAKKYNAQGDIGEIVEIIKDKGIVVKTGDSSLLITQIQAAGSRRMDTPDYLRGNEINKGQRFTEKSD